ncbi:phage tail protein [Klebsiella aerogenes]|uniref:phage tail protein n=1 Tax=Klebsiella aerogenes TaxID=548 RepID=UPI0034D26F25
MSDYSVILTDAGQALMADATAGGDPVVLTQFGADDGNGAAFTPDPAQTALINEVYRGDISSLQASGNTLQAQLIIPKDSGGYTVRGFGLYTDDGTLFSVCNFPPQEKPDPSSGYAVKMDVNYYLQVSDTSAVTLEYTGDDYLTREEADTIYLPLTGGALSGTLGFHDGDGTQAYAINRQAVWSLIDVYNALPLANSAWNKVGTVDTTKNQYGRASLTLVGSMSHDVGMAVQTGFVNIDIIGTEGSNPPGLTLTFFVPDEAKGAVIQTAVLSASPTQDKCFDLWVKTQTAVAGIMSYAKQTTAGYLTLNGTIETTDTDPEPSTPTGIVHLVSANKDGNVKIGGDLGVGANLKVDGTTTLQQAVNMNAGMSVQGTTNLNGVTNQSGDLNVKGSLTNDHLGHLIKTGTTDPDANNTRTTYGHHIEGLNGASVDIDFLEHVGEYFSLVLHVTGTEGDAWFELKSTGDFTLPGQVIPGNYGNFDERYLGSSAAYTKNESDTRFARNPGDAGFGGVGTYAFLSSNAAHSNGESVSGSELYASGVGAKRSGIGWGDKSMIMQGTAMAGTWMCCGNQPAQDGDDVGATLYYRIA